MIAVTLLGMAVACTGGGHGVGERCDTSGDCAGSLQCFERQCLPRCLHHVDCGDGYTCEGGQCQLVEGGTNAPCGSELQCGPGFTCRLRPQLSTPPGTCQPHTTANIPGGECDVDADCRGGACALGHCLELCIDSPECQPRWTCAAIPRLTDDAGTFLGNFNACLPSSGTITFEIDLDEDVLQPTVMLPVPSSAVALAAVMEVSDPFQRIGATHLESPDGRPLYDTPLDRDAFFANKVRHVPAAGISVVKIPGSPDEPLEPGAYAMAISVFREDGGPTSRKRTLRVTEKLGLGAALDLHFFFTDLEDHPCVDGMGLALDAASAQASPEFQEEFVGELRTILGRALATGATTYDDIKDQPELASLRSSQAGDLFTLDDYERGVAVFFVRSIAPACVQIVVGGTPGSPLPRTRSSGVAVSLEAMCYRDWRTLARQTAHAIARHLGLFRNVEPEGGEDRIEDSPLTTDNLMHYSEFGGTTLSPGQIQVLRASPGVQ